LTCSSLNGNPPPQYAWYRNSTLLTYDYIHVSFFILFNSPPSYSSSLNERVITTGNSSIYTFNVTRFDNQVKYECQIWNQALAIPLRVEQYLHVECKHRRKKRQLPYAHRFLLIYAYVNRSTICEDT
jgi:hypothetical protein